MLRSCTPGISFCAQERLLCICGKTEGWLFGSPRHKIKNLRLAEDVATHGDSAHFGEASAHWAHQSYSFIQLSISVQVAVAFLPASLQKPCGPTNIDMTSFRDFTRGQQCVLTQHTAVPHGGTRKQSRTRAKSASEHKLI
jgi:hypothetical protein